MTSTVDAKPVADPAGAGMAGAGVVRPAGEDAGVSVARFLAAAATVLQFVAEFDPARYDGVDATALVSSFTQIERVAVIGKSLAGVRATECRQPEAGGHPTPAHWLSDMTGDSLGDSTGVLKLGESLADHPAIDEAARKGKLSGKAARLVADAARVNPGSEDELVEAATHETFHQLRDRCLRAKAQGRSAEDAAAHRRRLHDQRHCRTWTDQDGAFCLDARLAPDAGASLLASLNARTDALFEEARREGRHESSDAYRADALVGLVTGRRGGSPVRTGATPPRAPGPGTVQPGDPEPGDSDLTDLTGDSDDPGDSHTGDSDPGPRAQVLLRVDLDALRRGSVGPGGVCEIPGVGPVSVESARELMGDAVTRLVITNGVDVTTVCHLGRSIPSALRTALVERDRSCVIPGCDVTQGLEIDHWGVAFAEGGPASLENTARLCGHHHYLRTHQGFTLTGGPGRWRWAPPARGRPPDPDDPDLALTPAAR